MYLIYALWLLSFLSKKLWMTLFSLFFLLLLLRRKHYKESLIFFLCASMMFIMHFHSFSDRKDVYRVVYVKAYKVHVRSGLNTYEIKGAHDYQLDDTLSIAKTTLYQTPTHYQKTNRIVGSIELEDTALLKRNFSIRKSFFKNMDEELFHFYDGQEPSIFSILSIQLLGLLQFLDYFLRKKMTQAQFKWVSILVCFIYGYLFGFRLSVIRILLKVCFEKLEIYLPILIILFPSCFYDPGFNLVYLPLLIQRSSVYLKDVNVVLLRMFLLLRTFGRLHLLEMIFYPFIRFVSGVILFLSLIRVDTAALFILKSGLALIRSPRFLLLGCPSLLWLSLFLYQDKKKEWLHFILMLLVLTYPPFIQVRMINVYQGDATLITYPFNSVSILIDTGRESAYKTLKQSLYKHGIKKLDYLIITHDDLDHSENKDCLMDEFKVSNLVETKQDKIPYMMQLLSEKTYADENENSLIFYFNTSRASFLFMGDAYVKQELDLIRNYPLLRVDVLKLGHHGSNTSTASAFLEHVRPKLALISSDPRVYNHPHPEVMKRLSDYRIPSLQTSLEQDVLFKLYPFVNIVVSQAGGFGIMK